LFQNISALTFLIEMSFWHGGYATKLAQGCRLDILRVFALFVLLAGAHGFFIARRI